MDIYKVMYFLNGIGTYIFVHISMVKQRNYYKGNGVTDNSMYVIVKSHYEEVIAVITQVRGGAEDKCNNNDNL